jgi:hypothetical protein
MYARLLKRPGARVMGRSDLGVTRWTGPGGSRICRYDSPIAAPFQGVYSLTQGPVAQLDRAAVS